MARLRLCGHAKECDAANGMCMCVHAHMHMCAHAHMHPAGRLSSARCAGSQMGVFMGSTWVGAALVAGPPPMTFLRSELPQRKLVPVCRMALGVMRSCSLEEEGGGGEEFNHSVDLKRHARLAFAWSRHGSLVPRWT